MDGIVQTIPYLCKRCYSCVRECPAIAIRVEAGQAVVIPDRCISCGHCVTVCSQNAKSIKSDVDLVLNNILKNGKTYALVAPSFPASFPEDFKKFPSALRKLGFNNVVETAFGADLVSNIYAEEIRENPDVTIISSACPAVYNYIESYYCELIPKLAKIVSPMIAMGRYLKENYRKDVRTVFIGPCIAKKSGCTAFIHGKILSSCWRLTEVCGYFRRYSGKGNYCSRRKNKSGRNSERTSSQ
jgi:two-component system, NtrC family, sensor kinase